MITEQGREYREQLIGDGYCHVPGVAPLDLIEQTRVFSERLVDGLEEDDARRRHLQGSLIRVNDLEEMVPMIILPAAIGVLNNMGFPNPKYYSGYIISKPPEASPPPLFWHQDGVTWDEPLSYTDTPAQVFLMYYLVDTNRDNGCLRVIPGSHRHRHRLHGLPQAHADEIEAAGEDQPALQPDPDEVDVPVKAGDLVIGDARLLHSAHSNRSATRRTVITLWFLPTYDELSESLLAFYKGTPTNKPASWTPASWTKFQLLLAAYEGSAHPAENNRIPDARLA